jgi:hypothetical protein
MCGTGELKLPAMVERIDKQVIPREALEARFKAIEDRLHN